MTTHADIFADGLAVLLGVQGQAIGYTETPGGAQTDVTAIVGDIETSEADAMSGPPGRRKEQTREITVSLEDIETPMLKGEFIVESARWAITSIKTQSETFAVYACKHAGIIEASSSRIRGR